MPLYEIHNQWQGAENEPPANTPKTVMLGPEWDDDAILEALRNVGRNIFLGAGYMVRLPNTIFIPYRGGELHLKRLAGRPNTKAFFREEIGVYAQQWADKEPATAVLELRWSQADPTVVDSYVDGDFFGTYKFPADLLGGQVLGIGANEPREGQVMLDDEPDVVSKARIALDSFLERGMQPDPRFAPKELAANGSEPVVGDRVRFATPEYKIISNYDIEISGMTGTVTQADDEHFIVKLDVFEEELIEWENECIWDFFNEDEMPKLELLPAESVELTVARRFAWNVREYLMNPRDGLGRQPEAIGLKKLREMVKRNATENKDTDMCASQDFCDANMSMSAAIGLVLYGDAEDEDAVVDNFEDPMQNQIWNDAWELAKRNHFFVGPTFYPPYTKE